MRLQVQCCSTHRRARRVGCGNPRGTTNEKLPLAPPVYPRNRVCRPDCACSRNDTYTLQLDGTAIVTPVVTFQTKHPPSRPEGGCFFVRITIYDVKNTVLKIVSSYYHQKNRMSRVSVGEKGRAIGCCLSLNGEGKSFGRGVDLIIYCYVPKSSRPFPP